MLTNTKFFIGYISVVLPVTRFASEVLLRFHFTGLLLGNLGFRLEYLMQLVFTEREKRELHSTKALSNAQSQGIIFWPLLHVITLFSVLSTNRTINTNVFGELSSAKQ